MALIMIVDDEPDMRLALSTVLKKEGHKIIEAEDSEKALEELARKPVELVLLDIRLPGMDGVQMLKRVRETRQDLPIIMVTGYGSVDTAVKLMQLGADGYLSKPFSNRQLVETVEKVLEVRRLEAHPLYQGLAEKIIPARATEPRKKPARPRKASAASSALGFGLIVAVVAAAFWAFHFFRMRASREYPLPFSNPTALTWEGEKLWAADWVTESINILTLRRGQLEAVEAFPLKGSHITGMAVVKGIIYTCDPWKKTIQKRRMDETLSVISEVPSPGPNPSGLYWDGRTLWSCDSTKGRFYQHEPETLAVVATYPSPGKAPIGLYKDEKYFWSADAETRHFYRHRLDEKLSVLAEYDLSELNVGSEPVSAITQDKGYWWVGRDGKNALLRFAPSALRSKP
jgi:CheY-like chemotaxis protein